MKLQRIEMTNNRPEVSDEEINRMMDFNKLLGDHRRLSRQRMMRNVAIIAGAVILSTTAYLFYPMSEPAPAVQSNEGTPGVSADSTSATTTPTVQEINPTPKKENSTPPTAIKKEPAPETTEPRQDQYTEAEPIDGYPNLYSYFDRELHYPQEAVKDSIEGTVSVSFVIDTSGNPTDIKVLNSLGPLFDEEARRIITNMPKWKAAQLNNESVPARLSVPLSFRIIRKNKAHE